MLSRSSFTESQFRRLIWGASLIEVMVSIVLIGVSLGAIFRLNNSAIDEIRALREHYIVQNMVNDLVKKTRLHYNNSLKDDYTLSGAGVIHSSAACLKNCTLLETAQYDLKVWTEELEVNVADIKYDLAVDDDEFFSVAIAWMTRAHDPKVSLNCPIDTGDGESCFFITMSLAE